MTDTSADPYRELREAAKAALPFFARGDNSRYDQALINAAFITLANPAAILALLAERDRLVADNKGLTGALNLGASAMQSHRHDLEAVEAALRKSEERAGFSLLTHLRRQREWSERTFGPGDRAKGVVDHIRKELLEIEAEPAGTEWVDVIILALDGFWRAGYSPEQIIAALVAKQAKNEARTWPDWRTMPTDRAIEHDRAALANEATDG